MQYVKWLKELRKDDVASAGGKGANLGELVSAGLPVPRGFVLLTGAYRRFVSHNNLGDSIRDLASGITEDPASVETASEQIRALFEGGQFPEDVREELNEAYEDTGGVAVAVRSSATAEDLPGASFAGQQETYLNVSGSDALLKATRRCWSSLWTPRALSYRYHQQIEQADMALAVIVQAMVEADAAGVLFTANPINGRRDQLVIDGAWGLGESVVSGDVTPDHWMIDRSGPELVETSTASKERMVVTDLQSGGTRTAAVPEDMKRRPVLNHPQLMELAALGEKVEAHYSAPQDIEWALSNGQLMLLQSRPITSLFPLPRPLPDPALGLRVYVCVNKIQGLTEPLTPMGLSVFARLGRGFAGLFYLDLPPEGPPPAFKEAALRIYADATHLVKHPKTRRLPLAAGEMIDHPMAGALQSLLDQTPELDADLEEFFPLRPRPGFVLGTLFRLLWILLAPDLARKSLVGSVENRFRQFESQARRLETMRERIQLVKRITHSAVDQLARLVPLVVVGMGSRFTAERMVIRLLGDAGRFQPLLRGLPHNPTVQMDLDLWEVSRVLKREGRAPTADHPAVRHFLDTYGHRAVREIDVGMPRWREDPTHIINILGNYLAHGEADNPQEHFTAVTAAAEKTRTDLLNDVRARHGALKAAQLAFLLDRTRRLVGVRERPKFLAVKFLALIRSILLEVGTELVNQGRLNEAEDVFFVRLDDLESGASLCDTARRNRQQYEAELQRTQVPRVVTSRGDTLYGSHEVVEGALVGTPASPGTHEGRVRVVLDPKGAHLEPGEILVAPGTDPAWTPLFLTAGALVMEIGGMMSHGSVVAREYGIPAVVGVKDATTQLHTGQLVRVDGEAGQVTLLE